MKKQMIITIVLMTIVIMMASFQFYIGGRTPIQLPEAIQGSTLFICPAADALFDAVGSGFAQFTRYIVILFFFCAIILAFMWGWALYQNLLKDSFNKDAFKTPWDFTKLLFWAMVIMVITINTPNRYRRVDVTGRPGQWVLCDNTSEKAIPVPANSVHSR